LDSDTNDVRQCAVGGIMGYEQTRDILSDAEVFHRQTSEYYHQLSDQAQKQRIKMLLDYLSRHEAQLANSLSDYEQHASNAVLDTWFKSRHKLNVDEILKDVKITPGMSVDDVIELGLKLDDCLITIYKDLAENAQSEEVRSVFQNLLDMEEEEKRQLVRNSLRVMDF
jgi:rubrerythrin